MSYQNPPKICPVCQKEAKFKFILDCQNKDGKFSLFECPLCEIQFWAPFRNPGGKWYEETRDPYVERRGLKIGRFYHKKFLEFHQNFLAETKILDLGCETGRFLNELKNQGCEVWGVDYNKKAIQVARKNFGLKNIYAISIEEFFNLSNLPKFDVITSFEVLEHLDNPKEFITRVKMLLKPNGFIAMSTPTRERFLPNLADWDFPPVHLTRWSTKSISNFLQANGFLPKIILYGDGGFNYIFSLIASKMRFGFVNKVRTLQASRTSKKKVTKDTPTVKIVHLLAYLKDYLFAFIPALFLYPIGKILDRTESILYVEATVIK